MRVAKRINNNAVMCIDSKGRNVVAFGKGIAFAIDKETGDLPLSAIERTFYNIDEHYLALLDEIKPELLSVAADIVEAADLELPYELNNNAVLALADHLTFALYRQRKGINVQMPIAYDVAQMYPLEFKVGKYAVAQVSRKLNVELPTSEVVGIAMCLFNASATRVDANPSAEQAAEDERLVDGVTAIIEGIYGIKVEREGFEYARFATHMHYLIDRLRQGVPFNDEGAELYVAARKESPKSAECLDKSCELLHEVLGQELTDPEKLYMIMHIHRISHPRV